MPNPKTTNTFEIKRGDTSPFIETVLYDGDGEPIDLTNAATVTFKMVACDHPRAVKLNRVPADFTASAAGEVWYEWQTGDTDTVGKYNVDWQVTFPLGLIMTIPSKGFDIVEVTPSL